MTAGPGALVMTPILTGMAAALTASQLAVIANNKPAEPTYLATGGLIQKRVGGINAVIGDPRKGILQPTIEHNDGLHNNVK